MKRKYVVFVLLLTGFLYACSQKEKPQPVPVIFDSDIAPDYDDVGAMALLHYFASQGDIHILATVSSNLDSLTVPSLSVFNTWFGRPDVPVGTVKAGGARMGCSQHWSDSITTRYPHRIRSAAEAEDAVHLYRRLLAQAEDTSVVIITVGFLTNLHHLLQSPPDSFSSLDGVALVNKKVKHWVCMGGAFPAGKEFNLYVDSLASYYVLTHWPRPVIFTGYEIGSRILTGLTLVARGCEGPVKDVYRISLPYWKSDSLRRCSWDQTAVLIAAKGVPPFFNMVKGNIIIHPDGSNEWKNSEEGPHGYVVFRMSPDSLAAYIEERMMYCGGENEHGSTTGR